MRFETTAVKGHGRGRGLGFPTINMVVPETIPVTFVHGVYSVRVHLHDEKYIGALYYGPVPVFNETKNVFEVYLLDVFDIVVREGETLQVEIVKFIRGVMNFDSPRLLVLQMEKDISDIRKTQIKSVI